MTGRGPLARAFLTEQSQRHSPATTDRLARRVLDHLDPAGRDRYDTDAYRRRALHAVVDSTGMLVLRGQLDPAASAVVTAALTHYSAPAPSAEGPVRGGRRHLDATADILAHQLQLTLDGRRSEPRPPNGLPQPQ